MTVLLVFSCTQNRSDKDSPDILKVTTTTGMINDIVLNVGKDKVSTQSLMGPGVDPHLYKASAKERKHSLRS